MGMDLEPIKPSADAPRYPLDDKYDPNGIIWGGYNWAGWSEIIRLLNEWGVDISEFARMKDGDEISDNTCKAVANAIEQHLPKLSEQDRNWLQPHIALWRTCGGYRQR